MPNWFNPLTPPYMPTKTQEVSWSTYARTYDMLLAYNPFYQALHQEVLALTKAWELPTGSVITDIGAGTGNYSIALAQQFPQAQVIHIDRDPGMCEVAVHKREALALHNLEIRNEGVETLFIAPESLHACTCIHALYTFPDPHAVLNTLYQGMVPGGLGILVDPGRPVKVWDWQWAIGSSMLKTYGLNKTLQVMREGKEVSRQNRKLSRMQAAGKLWMHSHAEFCEAVLDAGFELLEARTTFRGISDLVVVRKPG